MIKIKTKYIPKITLKQGIILTVVLAAIIVTSIFTLEFIRNRQELEKLKNPFYLSQLQSELSDKTLSMLGEIMLLPEGKPTIVNIVDPEALKKENPEFYKNSNTGDILVVYPNIAIILRVENQNKPKIINIAPVIQSETTPTPAAR